MEKQVYLMYRSPEGNVVQSEITTSMDTFLQTMAELGAVYNEVLGLWEDGACFDYWPKDA